MLLSTLVTLVALEVILRVADFRALREGESERSLTYRYDAELGWAPVPNSSSVVTTARTIHVQHNSLGFRDIEFERDARPRMLFIGNSFVWGVDAEANERFTDLLRSRIADYATVNAGVSGYGTDQEYLLLQRIWAEIQPSIVVLIFCTANDRLDNGTNIRYDGYQKPYFATANDGTLELRGQPVPISRQLFIKQNWLVRTSGSPAWSHSPMSKSASAGMCPMRPSNSSTRSANSWKRTAPGSMVGLQIRDDKADQHLTASEYRSSLSMAPKPTAALRFALDAGRASRRCRTAGEISCSTTRSFRATTHRVSPTGSQ